MFEKALTKLLTGNIQAQPCSASSSTSQLQLRGSMAALPLLCCALHSETEYYCCLLLFLTFRHLCGCCFRQLSSSFASLFNSPSELCSLLDLLPLQATQLINRLTPQKPARPAASDISKDE
jgi:hypothetical protein